MSNTPSGGTGQAPPRHVIRRNESDPAPGQESPDHDHRKLGLDAHYGIDWQHGPQNSPAGNLYPKNGSDGQNDSKGNAQVEQSGLVFLPLDMECVVFVNSPSANDLMDLISDSFTGNLVEKLVQPGGSPPGV